MALVVLVSAKGAPGVTTLTVALAALTPGAVAADLDPDGGDLGLRYRRPDGAPLDTDLGVLSLVAGLRRDQPGHRWLPPADGGRAPAGPTRLEDHLQVTGGGLDLLLGVSGPEQATGLGPLWSPLARALSEAGRTVYADCGRAGPAAPTMPVLHQADAVIVVARPELEELAHLRERLRFLNSAVPGRFAGRAQIGVVLVAPERDRAVAGRTEQLLHSSGVGVPVLGTMALDQRGAEALRGMNRSKVARSTLIRSVRSLLPSVSLLAGTIPELSAPVTPIAPTRPAAPPPARSADRKPKPTNLFDDAETAVIPVPTPEPAPRPAEPAVTDDPAEERTTPLRRRNSFFGDSPGLDDDPELLPITVAPGVFTAQKDFQMRDAHQGAVSRPTDAVRGFAGLTTPPESPDDLQHNRSRRAALGREPSAVQTSERRRSRRHVMPPDENDPGYSPEAAPPAGRWRQDAPREAPEASDKHAWSALRDHPNENPQGADVLEEPLPRLPRREPQPIPEPGADRPRDAQVVNLNGSSRARADRTEPAGGRPDEGTGWIAPDVPPTPSPSIPTAVPASSFRTSDALDQPEPSRFSAGDRTALLREIRDRARRGTDGSGTWAGHTRARSDHLTGELPTGEHRPSGTGSLTTGSHPTSVPADAPSPTPPPATVPKPWDAPDPQGTTPTRDLQPWGGPTPETPDPVSGPQPWGSPVSKAPTASGPTTGSHPVTGTGPRPWGDPGTEPPATTTPTDSPPPGSLFRTEDFGTGPQPVTDGGRPDHGGTRPEDPARGLFHRPAPQDDDAEPSPPARPANEISISAALTGSPATGPHPVNGRTSDPRPADTPEFNTHWANRPATGPLPTRTPGAEPSTGPQPTGSEPEAAPPDDSARPINAPRSGGDPTVPPGDGAPSWSDRPDNGSRPTGTGPHPISTPGTEDRPTGTGPQPTDSPGIAPRWNSAPGKTDGPSTEARRNDLSGNGSQATSTGPQLISTPGSEGRPTETPGAESEGNGAADDKVRWEEAEPGWVSLFDAGDESPEQGDSRTGSPEVTGTGTPGLSDQGAGALGWPAADDGVGTPAEVPTSVLKNSETENRDPYDPPELPGTRGGDR